MQNNRTEQQNAMRKVRQCYFCLNNVPTVDYKNTDLIKRFMSSFAKIVPRKRSKVCALHQRRLENAIKRSRIMALVPFIQR